MIANNPYAQYNNNKVLTATPQELTLMLYEGAIKFCNQAKVAIDNKNIQESHRLIIRVQDIIQELRITLNKKYPIAEQMERVYEYIERRLMEANMQKEADILEEVNEYLRELRDTWKEAMKLAKAKKATV